MQRTAREGMNNFLGDKAKLRGVSKKGGILLANLIQSSRSTFPWGSFPSFFAFKAGMLDTQISAPGGWPTVSGGFVRQKQGKFKRQSEHRRGRNPIRHGRAAPFWHLSCTVSPRGGIASASPLLL
jgi:hypothetical protein